MNIFKWFSSIFTSNEEEEVLEDNTKQLQEAEARALKVQRDRDRQDREIVSESQDNIKALSKLAELVEGTIYSDKLNEVVQLTSDIHDKIIKDERIEIKKLRSFNSWKTVEFINAFDHLFEPLRPKKFDNALLSDFKLKEGEEVEEVEEEVIVELTPLQVSLNGLEDVLRDDSTSIDDLKVHVSLNIYEYISDAGLDYNVKNNKEVKFKDAEVFDSFISFLNKNSSISLNTLYICSSRDNDKPILLDLASRELYMYDYNEDVKLHSHIVENDVVAECCEKILKG
jgi:hypothetical protein